MLRSFLPLFIISAFCLSSAFATDFTTERVVLNWVKKDIVPGDSLLIQGHVSSTDSTKQAYSRYVYVEVVNPEDSILTHQMCRLDSAGDFTLNLKTAAWWEQDMYYVRAYTRLMQNFSPACFGIRPLPIGIDTALYNPLPALPTEQPLRRLEILHRDNRLLWSINLDALSMPLESLKLYGFSDETGLEEIDIPRQGRGVIDLSQMTHGRLLHLFLLNSAGTLLDEGTVALPPIGEERFPAEELCDMVGHTQPDSLLLCDSKALGRWLQGARFVRFNISDVLNGQFSFSHPCEQQMTIRGRLMPPHSKKPIRHGTVTAMNFKTKETFTADTDDDGHYAIAVNDYADGAQFFVSAKNNRKDDNYGFYIYNISDDPFPAVSIPYRLHCANALTSKHREQRTDGNNKGFIQLGEANIHAKRRVPEFRPDLGKYMVGNYLSLRDHADEFPTMLQAIERIWRVRVTMVEDGKYALKTTRGIDTMQESDVGVMLDGMLISATELLYMCPFEIEDVEYLLPGQALKYGHFVGGLLYVRTAQLPSTVNQERRAKGVWIRPLGLTC